MTSRIRSSGATGSPTASGSCSRISKFFPAESAQVLEYWLDVTHFGDGKGPLPWNRERFLEDLAAYRSKGLKHIKSFGNGLDADYLKRHRDIGFLKEFATGLRGATA